LESEEAESRKTFTSERYDRLKTGGGSFETTDNIQSPEVEISLGDMSRRLFQFSP